MLGSIALTCLSLLNVNVYNILILILSLFPKGTSLQKLGPSCLLLKNQLGCDLRCTCFRGFVRNSFVGKRWAEM